MLTATTPITTPDYTQVMELLVQAESKDLVSRTDAHKVGASVSIDVQLWLSSGLGFVRGLLGSGRWTCMLIYWWH